MFCRLLFVLFGHCIICLLVIVLSVFWSLYYLSFGHCIICLLVIVLSVFWSLYYLAFGHCIICLLVIILSVFWSLYYMYFGHCIICLLVIVLSVFWSLYYMYFGHCVICLLVTVLSVFWSLYYLSFGHCIICLWITGPCFSVRWPVLGMCILQQIYRPYMVNLLIHAKCQFFSSLQWMICGLNTIDVGIHNSVYWNYKWVKAVRSLMQMYGSWIYNYLYNQCISLLKLWVRIHLMARCTRYNIMS